MRSTHRSGLALPWIGTLFGMERKAQHRNQEPRDRPTDRDALPVWRNTRPRGNPETEHHDLRRSVERMEAVLGR